uniref:Uncharacterized protein n=1 Tax=Octopus bimaculoides TaxID=37653 RepID=A0A0L8I9R0_OCTBM
MTKNLSLAKYVIWRMGRWWCPTSTMIACYTFLMKETLCRDYLCHLQLQIYVDGILIK